MRQNEFKIVTLKRDGYT